MQQMLRKEADFAVTRFVLHGSPLSDRPQRPVR
jgi:hypothetical protein